MTESLPSVVTPYARFLEYQDRRRRKVVEDRITDKDALIRLPEKSADGDAVPIRGGKRVPLDVKADDTIVVDK